jgi:hypothetical protein
MTMIASVAVFIVSTTGRDSEALIVVAAGLLIFSVILLVGFFLSPRLILLVRTSSSTELGLIFKRSLIEGIKVDFKLAEQVIEIINDLVMKSRMDLETAPTNQGFPMEAPPYVQFPITPGSEPPPIR